MALVLYFQKTKIVQNNPVINFYAPLAALNDDFLKSRVSFKKAELLYIESGFWWDLAHLNASRDFAYWCGVKNATGVKVKHLTLNQEFKIQHKNLSSCIFTTRSETLKIIQILVISTY